MSKRVSIFDLKEGKVYKAFDGKRELSKIYTVQNGKLMNASKEGDANDIQEYDGCEWVPLKASITFQEIKSAQLVPAASSILGLKKGLIYKSDSDEFDGLVARIGNKLMSLNDKKKPMRAIELNRVDLTVEFNVVGTMPKKAAPKKAAPKKALLKARASKSSSARR